jgi:hypothetical protein
MSSHAFSDTLFRDAIDAMRKARIAIEDDRYDEDDDLYEMLSEPEQDAAAELFELMEYIQELKDSEVSSFSRL